MKKLVFLLLVLASVLSLLLGCTAQGLPNGDVTVTGDKAEGTLDSVTADFFKTDDDMFTQRDAKTDYDPEKAITIQLNGSWASADASSVKISGPTVTVTEEASYVISGELHDGMLIVDAPDTAKLQLVFQGAHITSKTSAALYIREADKVFVTLADGTDNSLSNGGSFVAIDEYNVDGALFSKQDLTLNGTGSLTVTSPVGHGIVCKDDLVIVGGDYAVNSASHGLDANHSVRITHASLTVQAGKDAIHAENADDAALGFVYIANGTLQAQAQGDGISASAYMQIADGNLDLLVGGGSENGTKEHSDTFGDFMGGQGPGGMGPNRPQSLAATTAEISTSMKGLKAASGLLISGGNITVNSADDAIHSDASVLINGGTLAIASGDDAIHAEDTLTVTAGKINITESYEGLEALHIDVQGGDIRLKAEDDGLNAAGGADQSGTTGGRDGMFGGGRKGMGFGGSSSGSNGSIKVSGGQLYIHSSGDGLDANGTLEISGGYTVVVGPTQGDTATLDYDTSGVITGGTFIGTGAAGMAQTFSDSDQGVVAVRVGNQSSKTRIVLADRDGNVILEHAPELNFAVVILSDPQMKKGQTYSITVGSLSQQVQAS